MTERASNKICNSQIQGVFVKASSTVTRGKTVKFSDDGEVEDAGAGSDVWVGVALQTVTSGATAALRNLVDIVLPGPIVPMLVGTGGSTRGVRQKVVADGITDAAALAGDTAEPSIGFPIESGVAGDYVGVCVFADSRTKA